MKHLLSPSIVLGGGLLVGLVPAPTPGGLPQSALCPQLEHVTLSLDSNPPGGSELFSGFSNKVDSPSIPYWANPHPKSQGWEADSCLGLYLEPRSPSAGAPP